MIADVGRLMPQEFNSRDRCVEWLQDKMMGMKRSISLLSKEPEMLQLRMPITHELINIHGDREEITWLHLYMVRNQMYTTK